MNVLMIAFESGRWGAARLIHRLTEAGFRVAVLAPEGNAVTRTRFAERHFPLTDPRSSRHVAQRLAEAMRVWQPELIIPADEQVVALLHTLEAEAGAGTLSAAQCDLIARSLGDPARFDAMLMKSRTLEVARAAGVRVPGGATVASADEAVAEAERLGFPVFVKTSFSWSGRGVTHCADRDAVVAAMQAAQPPRHHRLRQRLKTLLHRGWYPTASTIDVQQAIEGTPAMYCVAAVAGRMVAGFAGIARRTRGENGPSTVVWIGPHPAMAQAAARMVEALGATGFIGFDFMIEAGTGLAYLLECNPRPIQCGHLGPRIGVDLCGAFARALRGETPGCAAPDSTLTVALFPQEWLRDPASLHDPALASDVPWDDDTLMRMMLEQAPHAPPPVRDVGVGGAMAGPSLRRMRWTRAMTTWPPVVAPLPRSRPRTRWPARWSRNG